MSEDTTITAPYELVGPLVPPELIVLTFVLGVALFAGLSWYLLRRPHPMR